MSTSLSPSLRIELNQETPEYTWEEILAAHNTVVRAYAHVKRAYSGETGFAARWILLEARTHAATALVLGAGRPQ